MKLMKITALLTVAIFGAVLTFSACKKDATQTTTTNADEETAYADDMARSEQIFGEAENFADEAEEMGSVQLKGGTPIALGGCASVTRDTTTRPRRIVIDFGTTNCTCRDGRVRRGKIIITFDGRYRDSGMTRTIRFDGYHVNDNHILGSKTVQNMGHNAAGHSYYNINVDGAIVLAGTRDTIKHRAAHVREWIAGERTAVRSDDEYSITGSGSITNAAGRSFSISITSPLIVALNCNWIKQGTVSITPAGASAARVLDYGSGRCDDQATITVNGRSRTITLR